MAEARPAQDGELVALFGEFEEAHLSEQGDGRHGGAVRLWFALALLALFGMFGMMERGWVGGAGKQQAYRESGGDNGNGFRIHVMESKHK